MSVKIDPDAFYVETEAAQLLGVGVDSMRRRRRNKQVSFCKHGQQVFYRGADLIAAIEAGREPARMESTGV